MVLSLSHTQFITMFLYKTLVSESEKIPTDSFVGFNNMGSLETSLNYLGFNGAPIRLPYNVNLVSCKVVKVLIPVPCP